MRTLAHEIEQAMADLRTEGEALSATFRFPPEFLGFEGHFPGQPILPAVCEVQAALTMLRHHYGGAKLEEIELAKFARPATCDETLHFRCVRKPGEGVASVIRTSVVRDDTTIARFRLRVILDRAEGSA